MATLTLQSATVLADGRIVRLVFEAEPVPAAHGVPDWRPGWAADKRLTLSTGATLEFIGAWATPYDRPVVGLLDGPDGDAGTTPVPGDYHVAYSVVRDSDGAEFFSPISAYAVAAGDGFRVEIGEGVHAIPAGYTARVYLSAPDGGPGTLALYRTDIPPATTYEDVAYPAVDDRAWDEPGTAWPGPARLAWTGLWLVTDPADVVAIDAEGLTVTGPAGLLADEHGNATAAFSAVAATNGSVVDADGFTSGLFTRGPGGVTVYVSDTHGDDARDLAAAQVPTTPVATCQRAVELMFAADVLDKGSAIRFLRGDAIAMGGNVALQYFGGPDRLHPFVFESYWDASFGADPGTRPVLEGGEFNAGHSGGRSHVVVRGLHLQGGFGSVSSFGTNDLMFDDNVFETLGGAVYNSRGVTFLRNVFRDIYKLDGQGSVALFLSKCDGALVSQNAFDFVGRTSADLVNSNMFSHAIYHQSDNRPLVLWGNLIREAGAYGVEMRAGGVAAYNVFTRDPMAAYLAMPGGYFYKNVIEKARDMLGPDGGERAWGFEFYAVVGSRGTGSTASLFESNFVLNEEGAGPGMALAYGQIGGRDQLLREATVRNNTISRAGVISATHWDDPDPSQFTYRLSRNIFHEDEGQLLTTNVAGDWSWYESDANLLAPPDNGASQTSLGTLATWKATTGSEAASVEADPGFVDPTADLGGFDALHGGDGTEAAHVAAVRDRAAGAWGDRFDMRLAWAFYGTQYRPATAPAGTGTGPWDYYGAADYREGEMPPTVTPRFPGRVYV